jgi:sec-independent protein translocase protein TatB
VFELSFEKILVIGLLAAFLLGPQHLPRYAAQLARLVRVVRAMAGEARGRLEEELGPDFDTDLRRLDPRQYDPRRIIRDALADDDAGAPEAGSERKREREQEPEDVGGWDPDPDGASESLPVPTGARAVIDDEAT